MRLFEFAKPKTFFAKRNLLNQDDLKRWAEQQGFDSILAEPHVTVAYSKQKFNWNDFEPQTNRLTIRGGHRSVQQFGKAIVLCFSSKALPDRWQEFSDGGASYDFPSYRPHVTITYETMPLDDMPPYDGNLIFGPEKFDEITEDWSSDQIEEVRLEESYKAQAIWTDHNGEEHDDVEDFATEAEARAWLQDYHAGRATREIWHEKRLIASLEQPSKKRK